MEEVAKSRVEELLQTQLSEDKKLLDLENQNIGLEELKLLGVNEDFASVEKL